MQKRKTLSRVLAVFLAVAMVAALVPVTAFAVETTEYSLTVASTTKAALAPGVTETTVVSYDSNGDRVQYFVVNADIATNDTVQVKANYRDNDNTGVWGKATVIEQANAAKEKRGYNVVASMNASFYNVTTGQPTGAFVMEGVDVNGVSAGNSRSFFAILDDGTAVIGSAGEYSNYADRVVEAVGGGTVFVKNGTLVSGLATNQKYPRTTVGITAEGNVVLMLADGNNKPYSAGLNYAEQGQLMLELGCVDAIELDGGGSSTYAAKLEGSDELEVRNVCCDGTVRSVSNTLMVISTAVADGTFDHANLSTDYAYYAAYSSAEINAVGADASGSAADIPEDVEWVLSDDSFGTISDGVFVSNGTVGTVTASMVYGGNVVGSIDISVVHPTSIAFSSSEKTVPYGKTSDFSVTSMYNGAEVYAPADVFDFTVSAGEMNGFIYQAPDDESVASAVVTAQYKYDDIGTISVNVTFGKGSEVLFDFEDGDISDWTVWTGVEEAIADGSYTRGYSMPYHDYPNDTTVVSNGIAAGISENAFLATAENGHVHSGNYALGYTFDYTQSSQFQNWQYGYVYYLGDIIKYRDVENGLNGTRLGMWMYIPEEAVGSCARLCYTYETTSGTISVAYLYFTYQYVSKGFSKLTSEKIPEAGWAYVYCDLDDISSTYVTSAYYTDDEGNMTRAAATNYAPAFIQWIVSSSAAGAEKCTFYIDDITLDYSDVVDDRDAPIISNPLALDDLGSYSLDGRTLDFNEVSFSADAAEDTSHSVNYTGIDASSAAVYVDGQKIDASYSAGKIATGYVTLPNGTHDVTFEIADKQGNYTKLTKQIVIDAESSDYPVVTLEGEALSDGKVKTGGQYNLLINTDKAEAIDCVTTTIWLNSASRWALDHMTALDGFEVTYALDELSCKADITVTRVDSTAEGAQTLVTIPVYAWEWDGSAGYDAKAQWSTGFGEGGTCPSVTISYKAYYGEVSYVDGAVSAPSNYVAGFSNKRQDVATELNSSITNLKSTLTTWNDWPGVTMNYVATNDYGEDIYSLTVPSRYTSIIFTDGSSQTVDISGITDGKQYYLTDTNSEGKWEVGSVDYDSHVADDSVDANTVYFSNNKSWDTVYAYVWASSGEWHYHTEKAVDDVAATCTEDGYTGRTVCIECNSVVDWGEVVPATGHQYAFVDGVLQCTVDGKLFSGVYEDGKTYIDGVVADGWVGDSYYEDGVLYTGIKAVDGVYYDFGEDGVSLGKYTGVFTADGETYYAVLGELQSGWQTDSDNWYYFNTSTYTAYTDGRYKVGMYYYTFDENGVCTAGQFVKSFRDGELITRYVFAGKFISWQFYEVDGNTYWFYRDEHMATGTSIIQIHRYGEYSIYDFDDNGVCLGIVDVTGVYDYGGTLYSLVDGVITARGAFEYDGGVYFSDWLGVVKTGKYYVGSTNDVITTAGYYYFDETTGRMYDNEVAEVDGVLYYFVGGQPVKSTSSEVVSVNGDLYFVNWNGKVSTGKVWVDTVNDYAPAKGYYYFGEDGKMLNNEVYDDDGTEYFIVNGQPYKTGVSGVKNIDGDLYYVNWNGKVGSGKVWVDTVNEYVSSKGYYYFDENGKMINNAVFNDDGIDYFIVNGQPYKTGESSVKNIDGELYFIHWNGRIGTGKIWVDTVNDYAPTKGYYYFDENGKMLNLEVFSDNGTDYFIVNGQPYKTGVSSVKELGGERYFVHWNGRVGAGKLWVDTVNDYAPTKGYYYFAENGRMLNGEVFNDNGTDYFIVDGQPYKTGVSGVKEFDGELYYVNWNGRIDTGKVWVDTVDENITAKGYYYFDENAKMIDGAFFQDGDTLYYIVNGKPFTGGVFECDGSLYYANWKGVIAVDSRVYIVESETNDCIIYGWHDFDETGKMYT